MLRFCFKPGLVFIEGVVRWELRRRLPSGKLQFEAENGELLNLSDQDVGKRWLTHIWVVDQTTLGSSASAMYLAIPRDLATFSESNQKEAKRRLHYLKRLDPENNAYNPARWKKVIKEAAAEIGDIKPPAPSTVAKWWTRYRQSKSILALVPYQTSPCGPRSKERHAIFEEVVGAVYMTKQQLPKLVVFDEMVRRIKALNVGRSPEEQIKCPARSTIYRWLDALHQDLVDAARLGAEAARVKYRAVLGKLKVGGALERVEIDHTPIDLIIIDSLTKLPLGRPWLTVAIDSYSKMVLGFYISFNAPSAYSVLQCLRQSFLPKDALLAKYEDIKGQWPAYGLPDLVAVDNGPDLHAEAVEATCLEMDIEVLFCGAKTPWQKGSIERFMRTVGEGLFHRLPGTVFSSIDARGDYPAEELAVIDMKTLVHLLIKWIVDVYNVSPHRGISGRPIDRWFESVKGRLIELPVYPDQLAVMTGIPAKRTVFHYGIELEGLYYNNDLLQMIRRREGNNPKVDMKFYEDSVAYIHVFDSKTKEYIEVPAIAADYANDLPRDIHRLVRENTRKRFGEQCNTDQLQEARVEIEEIVKQAIKDKRMGTRKKGVSLMKHDSESVLGDRDPLEKARKPVKKANITPPQDLPSGLDDDLPEIKQFKKGGRNGD